MFDKIKAGHVSKEAGLVFTRLPKPVEKRPWKNYFTSWRKFVIQFDTAKLKVSLITSLLQEMS